MLENQIRQNKIQGVNIKQGREEKIIIEILFNKKDTIVAKLCVCQIQNKTKNSLAS